MESYIFSINTGKAPEIGGPMPISVSFSKTGEKKYRSVIKYYSPKCGNVALYSKSDPWQSNGAASIVTGMVQELLITKVCYQYEV